MKSYKSSKSNISKKSLYLAIVFVVISTAIIVAVSLKRSFRSNVGESMVQSGTSSAALPTVDFKSDVKKTEYDLKKQNGENSKINEASGSGSDVKQENLNKKEIKEEPKEKKEEPKKKPAPVKKAVNTRFVKPLEGDLLQAFSGNELAYSKTLGEYRTHNGIDIKALPQTPVRSVFDGTIVDLYNDAGRWGTCIELKNDATGLIAIYRGLDENVNVKLESKVKAGEIIGVTGNTNAFEGALESHLHFELKKGEDYVDPLKYLKYQSDKDSKKSESDDNKKLE